MQHYRNGASIITTTLMVVCLFAAAASVSGQRAQRRVATGSLPRPRFADPDGDGDRERFGLRSIGSATAGGSD